MVYFTDNDLILKLAAWNLLDETLGFLEISEADIRVLGSLSPQVRNQLSTEKGKLFSQYGVGILERTNNFCKKTHTITDTGRIQDLEVMRGIFKVDPGEAVLIANACANPDSIVMTGDKQCIGALGGCPAASSICSALQGRIIHLEQIILGLINHKGIKYTRNKIMSFPNGDKSINGAFSHKSSSSKEFVVGTLENSIASLRGQSAGMLKSFDL